MGTQSSTPDRPNLYSNVPHAPNGSVKLSFPQSGARVWADSIAKRLFDIVVASIGLIVLLPLFAAIALLVRLTSPGPVLFRQQRVGKGQVPFTIYKYRTMYIWSEGERSDPSVTRCGDHRFTSIGPYLRKFKLDELPQLINVIRGDMSLVGPRPKLSKHERMRMTCKPGLTGAATIVFAREQALLETVPEESFEHFTMNVLNHIKAKIDEEYLEVGTFKSDLGIIFATLGVAGHRKPAESIAELLTVYGQKPTPTGKSSSPAA